MIGAEWAWAQDAITISGVVTTHADGAPVPGAVVSISGTDLTATADAGGTYTLQVPRTVVHGDRLQLKVDALGLPTKVTDVVVNATTLTVNVALSLGFSEQVTVGSRTVGA